MIDLFSVKLNKDYDFIQADVPAGSGTWLCSETNGDYVKGYSYEVIEGVATRIEQSKDYLINNAIYSTIESVCSYLNNMFFVKNRETELRTRKKEKEGKWKTKRENKTRKRR